MKQTYILAHDIARQRAVEAVRNAPGGFVVTVAETTRSLAENALLHALLTHLSRTQEWAGKKRDVDTWKRLMTAAWCRAIKEPVEMLPALDGHGVDIVYRKTSKLSRSECASLIDFLYAWGAMNGISFPAAKEAA